MKVFKVLGSTIASKTGNNIQINIINLIIIFIYLHIGFKIYSLETRIDKTLNYNEMQNNKNKKTIYPNSVRGTQRFTKPSRTNGAANIQINSEIAIPKLKILAEKYYGITDPYGFLTNLRNTLGISDSEGASKYGEVRVKDINGKTILASLRITNHNSNAETYVTHDANYPINVSILVRKNFKKIHLSPIKMSYWKNMFTMRKKWRK